jgi:hypothetical protein
MRYCFFYPSSLGYLVLGRFSNASMPRFDASIPRFDTCFLRYCFDARFDNRSEVGVWSRRHSILGFHACFDIWSPRQSLGLLAWFYHLSLESLAASMLALARSTLAWGLDASMLRYLASMLRYSLRCSLECLKASLLASMLLASIARGRCLVPSTFDTFGFHDCFDIWSVRQSLGSLG